MIVIAESGSTKCDWIVVKDGVTIEKMTMGGYNPRYDGDGVLKTQLNQLRTDFKSVEKVFFYGAGCSTDLVKAHVGDILTKSFPQAEILVQSDMKAVVDATCYPENGICAILGTGANACLYMDGKVTTRTPSLGYIFSDEGSGYYHGKLLLRAYFFGKFSKSLTEKFEERYGKISRDEMLSQVYQSGSAKAYISSFMPFVFENFDEPEIVELSEGAYNDFIDVFLEPFGELKDELKVYFVGSVAFYGQKRLKELLERRGFSVAQFVRNPIEILSSRVGEL